MPSPARLSTSTCTPPCARREHIWPIASAPDGSFYFDNQPNIFTVNKNMAIGDAPIRVDPGAVQISKLPAMVKAGVYPKPIPFGGMGDPVNQNGFSDHFRLWSPSSARGRPPPLRRNFRCVITMTVTDRLARLPWSVTAYFRQRFCDRQPTPHKIYTTNMGCEEGLSAER
jgi:hypothetical protein